MPDYNFRIEKDAIRFLKTVPQKQLRQLVLRIFELQANPYPHDSKRLKGVEGALRLDQGEYRILYTVTGENIQVFRIGKRNDDEVYRNL